MASSSDDTENEPDHQIVRTTMNGLPNNTSSRTSLNPPPSKRTKSRRNRDGVDDDTSITDEQDKVGWSSGDDAIPLNEVRRRPNRALVSKSSSSRSVFKGRGKQKGLEKKRKRTPQHELLEEEAATNLTDEDELSDSIPDYILTRQKKFQKRVDSFREAGLRLAPNYDEIEFSDDERLERLAEKPKFPNMKRPALYKDIQLSMSLGLIPAPIAQWLRDYQVEGVQFLHKHFVYQTGCILGDDMGLGKTIQVIAFLTAAFGKTGDERDAKRMRKVRRLRNNSYPRTLIVCPGTLIENWQKELQRWGWWHVDVCHGDTKETAIQASSAGMTEIMLTTYTTYRMNKSAINMVEWDCVIADECHVIKGRRSLTTLAMNEVNSLCRIGLTGTAIQNSYDELWTLLNWTNPGKFGSIRTWKTSISEPLKLGQSHEATIHQLGKARKTAKALVENLLPQFFLRRLKSLIADQLPKKTDRVVFCPLTDTQVNAYENYLDSDFIDYLKRATDPCDCGSEKKRGWCCYQVLPNGTKWQSYIFPAIVTLQKMANHLAILIPQSLDPVEKQKRDLNILQIALPDDWRPLYRNRDSITHYNRQEFCGKWKILKKLLSFWHDNGDKVLIFSHSVRLLRMLKMLFTQTAYNMSYLDGSMSYEERANAVDDFNSDANQFVFLISTKAGGVGLNITSANKVVVVDPNWNPSYDLQAQDRAYRIGQVRDVEVFRLVSAGTIEEIVYARQIYKQQQANIGYTASKERRYFKGIQNSKDAKGEIFGLSNLFAFAGDNVVLRDIVNKTNIAESRAGVSIVDLDIDSTTAHMAEPSLPDSGDDDDDDDEDGAISQLVSFVAGDAEVGQERSNKSQKVHKKSDPIQAILSAAGVEYMHENSEVIGSSKVEAHLSRRAEAAGNDLDTTEQQVFVPVQTSPSKSSTHRSSASGNVWQYHPPFEIQKRQFCTIAKPFGYADVIEFALEVENWTQTERRDCLERFYSTRHDEIVK